MKTRPQKYKDIDPKLIEKLASYGNSQKEIADAFGMPEDIFSLRYSTFCVKGREHMKKRLRKKQIETAMKGNATMLIWLGKQYLNQSDKQEHTGVLGVKILKDNI